jgi:precorrin-2/cobalt-factor-2 C20-methyltransferase
MTGTLYGVGLGPGDAELVTFRAARAIRESGIVAVPNSGDGERVALSIAQRAVPEMSGKQVVELDMPMTKDEELLRLSHMKAADLIIGYLKKDINVAFLTLGDPCIYSTYIYIHRLVRKQGFRAEIIPGVPSFCAVSAKLGDALAETSQPLHIIPGSYEGLRRNLELPGTKVIMKSGKSFSGVLSELTGSGQVKNAKMVENCGRDNERVVENLLDLGDDSAGYFSIIIVKDDNDKA